MELCKDSGDAETPGDEDLGNDKAHFGSKRVCQST